MWDSLRFLRCLWLPITPISCLWYIMDLVQAHLFCVRSIRKNNMQAIHAIEGIALRFSIIISGIVALIAFTAPQLMMKIFTSDQKLISIGSSYLRIMGITYLCWGITEVYLAILRSIGRVTISMALNMLAFILNIILNATFIFGLFGAPKLGATGVAIATAASRLIELAACVIVSFLSKDVKLNLTFMFIRSKVLFGDFVRLSLPALGNDVSWSVAFSMYSVILGHLGTDAVAANSLVTVVRKYRFCVLLCNCQCGNDSSWKMVNGKRGSGEIEGVCFQNAEDDHYSRCHWRCDRICHHASGPEICILK